MKERYCDFCGEQIPKGTDYIKCAICHHEKKVQTLFHCSDMCVACHERSVRKKDV